jgi:hypothetical protein
MVDRRRLPLFDLRRYWQSVSEADPAPVVVFVLGLILAAMVTWIVVQSAS